MNLEGKVAGGGVEGELDADGVEDVAGEEGQPADKEGCWVGTRMKDSRSIGRQDHRIYSPHS